MTIRNSGSTFGASDPAIAQFCRLYNQAGRRFLDYFPLISNSGYLEFKHPVESQRNFYLAIEKSLRILTIGL